MAAATSSSGPVMYLLNGRQAPRPVQAPGDYVAPKSFEPDLERLGKLKAEIVSGQHELFTPDGPRQRSSPPVQARSAPVVPSRSSSIPALPQPPRAVGHAQSAMLPPLTAQALAAQVNGRVKHDYAGSLDVKPVTNGSTLPADLRLSPASSPAVQMRQPSAPYAGHIDQLQRSPVLKRPGSRESLPPSKAARTASPELRRRSPERDERDVAVERASTMPTMSQPEQPAQAPAPDRPRTQTNSTEEEEGEIREDPIDVDGEPMNTAVDLDGDAMDEDDDLDGAPMNSPPKQRMLQPSSSQTELPRSPDVPAPPKLAARLSRRSTLKMPMPPIDPNETKPDMSLASRIADVPLAPRAEDSRVKREHSPEVDSQSSTASKAKATGAQQPAKKKRGGKQQKERAAQGHARKASLKERLRGLERSPNGQPFGESSRRASDSRPLPSLPTPPSAGSFGREDQYGRQPLQQQPMPPIKREREPLPLPREYGQERDSRSMRDIYPVPSPGYGPPQVSRYDDPRADPRADPRFEYRDVPPPAAYERPHGYDYRSVDAERERAREYGPFDPRAPPHRDYPPPAASLPLEYEHTPRSASGSSFTHVYGRGLPPPVTSSAYVERFEPRVETRASYERPIERFERAPSPQQYRATYPPPVEHGRQVYDDRRAYDDRRPYDDPRAAYELSRPPPQAAPYYDARAPPPPRDQYAAYGRRSPGPASYERR